MYITANCYINGDVSMASLFVSYVRYAYFLTTDFVNRCNRIVRAINVRNSTPEVTSVVISNPKFVIL